MATEIAPAEYANNVYPIRPDLVAPEPLALTSRATPLETSFYDQEAVDLHPRLTTKLGGFIVNKVVEAKATAFEFRHRLVHGKESAEFKEAMGKPHFYTPYDGLQRRAVVLPGGPKLLVRFASWGTWHSLGVMRQLNKELDEQVGDEYTLALIDNPGRDDIPKPSWFGGSDLHTMAAANNEFIGYLGSLYPEVDSENITLEGESLGGFNALEVAAIRAHLTQNTERVVAIYPAGMEVTSLTNVISNFGLPEGKAFGQQLRKSLLHLKSDNGRSLYENLRILSTTLNLAPAVGPALLHQGVLLTEGPLRGISKHLATVPDIRIVNGGKDFMSRPAAFEEEFKGYGNVTLIKRPEENHLTLAKPEKTARKILGILEDCRRSLKAAR